MLGCIQPMSSPMMKRMLGFCAGCCAVAGVLAGPDNENDINVVAPSNAAQDRLCQRHPLARRDRDKRRRVLEYAVNHDVILFFVRHQKLLA